MYNFDIGTFLSSGMAGHREGAVGGLHGGRNQLSRGEPAANRAEPRPPAPPVRHRQPLLPQPGVRHRQGEEEHRSVEIS